jgi:hypothetical protein
MLLLETAEGTAFLEIHDTLPSISADLTVGGVDHPIKKAIRREMHTKQTTACTVLIGRYAINFLMRTFQFLFMGTYRISKADM